MSALPRDTSVDATLAFLREGYSFISNRCERLDTDVFRTRLMLRDVVCMRGPRAIRLLYGAPGLTRRGAMPRSALQLLQHEGSVQTLDGMAHRHRKHLFVRMLVESSAAEDLASQFEIAWTKHLQAEGSANVLASSSDVLAKVVTDWAGFGAGVSGDPRFRSALFQIVDHAGRFGPGMLFAHRRRRAAERLVNNALEVGVPPTSPAGTIERFTEDGRQIPRESAVTEILNVLRPVVAVGRYIAFAARRLALEPQWRARLKRADEEELRHFAEEVRRTSPFFPVATAITTQHVSHEGLDLGRGQWLLADLWGTMQHPMHFPEPDAFRPERGLDWKADNDGFVPQGGGDIASTHRCPGDRVSVALIMAGLRVLCRNVGWRAPPQNLDVSLSRMPAQPASGVQLAEIVPASREE